MKNRTVLIAVLVIFLAFGAGLFWSWLQGTPYYSLYQIGAGLKNRDINTIVTYVDMEAVLNQQVSESISPLLNSLVSSSSLGKLTGPLELKIKLSSEANRGLSRLAIDQLRIYLENPENNTLPSSFLLLTVADFKTKGDYALVSLTVEKEHLRLGMRKQDGLFRVVEINPEDAQRLIKTYLLSAKQK